MSNLKVDFENVNLNERKILSYANKVEEIHNKLNENANKKDEFLGWLELPNNYDKKEFEKIKKCSKEIQESSDILLVIGIGGSYLGARAVIESLTNTFYNMLDKNSRKTPQILYIGNNLSSNYLNDLVDLIGDRDLSINVISKSGTTTEPAIAFRFFREFLESKYGIKEARKRIYVTTDKKKGALKELAKEEKYTCFVIPDNVGGRYSVLTAVGLLPIATAGIDIDLLMEGAKFACDRYADSNLKYKKQEIWASVLEYINSNKSMILDGFVTFRLNTYLSTLEEIVDTSVNEYVIEKEYTEFINLLKLYIDTKEPASNIVHLIYTNGNSILLNEHKNLINLRDNNFNAKYLSDISFSSNDYALNALLTLLPRKIEIHLIGIEDEFINTLQLIFENRISICLNCDICDIYKCNKKTTPL